jgi:hypothetical protein
MNEKIVEEIKSESITVFDKKRIDELLPEEIDAVSEQISQIAIKCGCKINEMKDLHRLITNALEKPNIEDKKKNLFLIKPKIAYMVRDAKTKKLAKIMLSIIDSAITSHTGVGYTNLEVLNSGILAYFIGMHLGKEDSPSMAFF